jgi:hypothetical protein
MNRRKFLAASLAATTGGILVAADLLSTKTFFLPPNGGWRQSKPLPVVYGKNDYRYGDHCNLMITVKPGLLQYGDLVSFNDQLHRVIGIQLEGGLVKAGLRCEDLSAGKPPYYIPIPRA